MSRMSHEHPEDYASEENSLPPRTIDLRTMYHCPLTGAELDDAVSTLVFEKNFFQTMVAARGLDDPLTQGAWKNFVVTMDRIAGIL